MRHRKRSRQLETVVITGVVLALVVPMAAWGIVQTFNDVPPSHPFYNSIEWMSRTGIANGYADGGFHPADPVTRQAMSAFVQRAYDVQNDMANEGSVAATLTSSTSWIDLGLPVSVFVPKGTYADLDARFSGESMCEGTAGAYCSVRLLFSTDGGSTWTEMAPNSGADYAFDTATGATDYDAWEGHAVERYRDALYGSTSGLTVKVKTQIMVTDGAVSFRIDDWTLVAQTDVKPSTYAPVL